MLKNDTILVTNMFFDNSKFIGYNDYNNTIIDNYIIFNDI